MLAADCHVQLLLGGLRDEQSAVVPQWSASLFLWIKYQTFNYCLFSINNAVVAKHQVPQPSQQHFHFIPSFNQLDVARGNFCLPPGLKLKSNRMCSKVGIKLRVNIYSRGFAGSVLHYQEQLCDNLYDVPCLEHEVPLPLDRL